MGPAGPMGPQGPPGTCTPAPPGRLTMAYYLPTARFAEALARGVEVGQVPAPNLGYLSAAKAAGLLVDYELQAHTSAGLDTVAEIQTALNAAKAGGYQDTIRRILVIDEPDGNWYYPNNMPVSPGPWDMNKFRSIYAAIKAIHPWPVWVLVRGDSNTYPRCVQWFPADVSDGIAWDPYLAFYNQYAEQWITTECQRLRTGMGPTKPLTCVLQAGYINWASDMPTYPPTRPTIDKVKSMGLAALAAGANDIGLWFEEDWGWMVQPNGTTWRTDLGTILKLPNIPPVWNSIKVATDAWKAQP